jgi:hypothetical protein
VPESKHRKKHGKRAGYHAEPPRPKASPKWVPYAGVGGVAAGALIVIGAYVAGLTGWLLLAGFGLMAAGLVALSQWR